MIIEIHLLVLIGIIVFASMVGLITAGLLGAAKIGDYQMQLAEMKRAADDEREEFKKTLEAKWNQEENGIAKLMALANEQLAMDLDILQKKYEKIYIELDSIKGKKPLSNVKIDEKGRLS